MKIQVRVPLFLLLAGVLAVTIPRPAEGQNELKAFLASLAGKKALLRQAVGSLIQRAAGDLRISLTLDLDTLSENELTALTRELGFFVVPLEYTFAPFNEKTYDKKTDTIVLELNGDAWPRRLDLRLHGIWKLKTGAAQAAQQMLNKVFFPPETDGFARKLQIDEMDKELIAKYFTPYPRLAQLSASQKQLLLDRLKRLPGAASIRFEQLGEEVYFVSSLGRFPVLAGEGETSADSELDSSRGSLNDRISLVLSRSLQTVKEVGRALGPAGGISGVCFEVGVWTRDFTKDNYIRGTQLQKSQRKLENVNYYIPASVLTSLGRDEITPEAVSARTTVKVDGNVVRRPAG